jgi:hypothetical protein
LLVKIYTSSEILKLGGDIMKLCIVYAGIDSPKYYIVPENEIYPRNDHETVYLKNVISDPNILVGSYTFYND